MSTDDHGSHGWARMRAGFQPRRGDRIVRCAQEECRQDLQDEQDEISQLQILSILFILSELKAQRGELSPLPIVDRSCRVRAQEPARFIGIAVSPTRHKTVRNC